ncbi:Uma2 family endonuclease [Scytonema sp. NUACC26]|uniref:Uma2 family endonuclease n=1 Tax=Scytonema sp. NUACC26 TaxID=3140176 RepID=UPI0034DC7B12
MYAVISSEKIQLPSGTLVRMPGSWQLYLTLCDSRGDSSIPRIKYRSGEILLMSPLPKHGREANILADVVKVLLDAQNRNYEAFTPITMELPSESGIEPDYCFYIDNWQAVVGRDRLDWDTDPSPDLAIEIDVTSYTDVNDYTPYRIAEVWIFKRDRLAIYGLQENKYQLQPTSRYFPNMDLGTLIVQCLKVASDRGTGVAIRELRSSLALDKE